MDKMKKLMVVLVSAIAAIPGFVSAAGIATGDLMTSAQSSGLTPGNNISSYVTAAFNWIIAVVGLLAILGFLISAVMYFTAAGDEDKITKAKSAMTYSIIGVVVALMGFVVMNVVQNFLASSTI